MNHFQNKQATTIWYSLTLLRSVESDQHQFSPNNISTTSREKVRRIY